MLYMRMYIHICIRYVANSFFKSSVRYLNIKNNVKNEMEYSIVRKITM